MMCTLAAVRRAMWVVGLGLAVAAAPLARAATGAQVDAAVQKAKDFLYAHMNGDNWEEVPRAVDGDPYDVKAGQWGGLTAIAAYALLAAGETEQHSPRLAAAIKWLRTAQMRGVYAVGVRMQVWLLLGRGKENRDAITKDATVLLQSVRVEGPSKGFYDYIVLTKGDRYDHSVSQYAVLGMWAAQQLGAEVPTPYWKLIEEAWRKDQLADGGWAYEREKSTASMTAAGVASLFIFQDMIHGAEFKDCSGTVRDPAIERGLDWMSKHYAEVRNDRPFYGLYGVERIGVASGRKYFGSVDWYKDGAAWLLTQQEGGGNFGGGDRKDQVSNTCFGILFLVRGRAPVMMNKLEYAIDFAGEKGPGGKEKASNWNNRPRDAANLSHWAGRQLERPINWQIVNLGVDPDDWHDAPILYVTGNQALAFKDDDLAKLRRFVEDGGLILGNADCNSLAFAASFERVGEKMFPGLKFRPLPADHLILNTPHPRSGWKQQPSPRGLSNGARELMVVFPAGDPARLWQVANHTGPASAWSEVAENLFLYCANKAELRSKEETYIVRPDLAIKADSMIKVARLLYTGKDAVSDPEPGGWRRLAAISHNTRHIGLDVQPVTLGQGKLTADFKVAHMTGTRKVEFSGAALDELRAWVKGGGTLIADACGGSTEFAEALETQLGFTLAGKGATFAVLPADHAIYTAAGAPAAVEYRSFARRLGASLKAPRVRALEVGGRTAVYFSREDLSVGLVGNSVEGVTGYAPKSAADITLGMIYHAAGVAKAPAKAP